MAVEQFLTFLQHEKRYSPYTVTSYSSDLLQFKDFVWLKFEAELSDVTYQMAREFIVYLLDEVKSTERMS